MTGQAAVGPSRALLRTAGGEARLLPVERWTADPAPEEDDVLARAVAPVLDVGCGPGRHVLSLARAGYLVLGIDVAPYAVVLARSQGAPVLERSVFARVPGAGRWATVLLLDGNVGIAGDPPTLLRRIGALLRPGGRLLTELEPPGTPGGRELVRLEVDGRAGPWFPWARVGVDDAGAVAGSAGMVIREVWSGAGRWFARLDAR
jgi:SAM-dependent methyltransferase